MNWNVLKVGIWSLALITSCSDDKKTGAPGGGQDELLKDVPFIYTAGEAGYAVFRTPTMVVTKSGAILAFAEGRVNNQKDEGDIDIVMKRSDDGGKTWSELVTLQNDGLNPCKNQCPVVLENGRILYLWLWNESIESEDERTTRKVFVNWSDDDGKTWSENKDITTSVYRENWGWYGAGPCHGIQLSRGDKNGRILMPCRHELLGAKTSSHIIYSDDMGETWHIGGIATRDRTTESTVVELSDGTIMLNSRNAVSGTNFRMKSYSYDCGETIDRTEDAKELIEPDGCQGSILYHSFNEKTGKGNILFTNPNHRSYRVQGTIKLSEDDGETWTKQYMYSKEFPAFSGYSDIAVMPNGSDVAVLYETGVHYDKELRYKGIAFKIIKFEDIK